jgi:ABC-2 type transport system ATP-binding protein
VTLTTADPERVVALLNGGVVHRDGERLVIAHPDAAALNAQLVTDGIRVAEIGPERRTLEQVVLEATTSSSDRVEAQ